MKTEKAWDFLFNSVTSLEYFVSVYRNYSFNPNFSLRLFLISFSPWAPLLFLSVSVYARGYSCLKAINAVKLRWMKFDLSPAWLFLYFNGDFISCPPYPATFFIPLILAKLNLKSNNNFKYFCFWVFTYLPSWSVVNYNNITKPEIGLCFW